MVRAQMTKQTSSTPKPPRLLLTTIAAMLATSAWAAEPPPQTSNKDDGIEPAARAKAADRQGSNDHAQHLERVEVEGTVSDDAKRRASTASKIIIGRDEIERYGDTSAGDVLKRLPGVTVGGRPGRGGGVQMRGMGAGYTQILVNGERMPSGFSLNDITPSQIERIEVMRAPTAEFGARAIAGTINIVLREAPPRRLNELKIGLSSEKDIVNPRVTWSRNDAFDDKGSTYNVAVTASRSRRKDELDAITTTTDSAQHGSSELRSHSSARSSGESLNATGRLQLKLGDDVVAIQPFVMVSRGDSRNTLRQTLNSTLPGVNPYPYDQAASESDSSSTFARLHLQWTSKLSDSTRVETRAAVGRMDARSLSDREERNAGAFFRSQDDETRSSNRSWSLSSKLTLSLENEHSLVVGLEGEGMNHRSSRDCLQTYNQAVAPSTCAYLADIGENTSSSTMRLAGWAQDEWTVGKDMAFYAGLRWEAIRTESNDAQGAVTNTSKVMTPLLHGLYKLDGKGRELIRASLTRSYRPPDVGDLGGRLTISSLYPCGDPTRPCTTNEINSPDFMGNPGLKSEMATGVEIGYEKYLSKGGLLSANLFYRHITGLIRHQAALETVAYAPVPRWVVRPRNIGDATAAGLEMEAKFRLDEYFEGMPGINLRSNVSLFRSSVEGIPGPNNRLDQQPRYVANLGADYRLRSVPVSLGASLNYTPTTLVQQSQQTQVFADVKRLIDAFAIWHMSPSTNLRVSASNLLPLDYANGSQSVTDMRVIRSLSAGPSYTFMQLSLEMKI